MGHIPPAYSPDQISRDNAIGGYLALVLSIIPVLLLICGLIGIAYALVSKHARVPIKHRIFAALVGIMLLAGGGGLFYLLLSRVSLD